MRERASRLIKFSENGIVGTGSEDIASQKLVQSEMVRNTASTETAVLLPALRYPEGETDISGHITAGWEIRSGELISATSSLRYLESETEFSEQMTGVSASRNLWGRGAESGSGG